MSEILLPTFSFRIFIVLTLTFKFLIPFEFIFVYGVRKCPILSLCNTSFANSTYWIDSLYHIVCSCLLCQILIDHKGVGLFLGSLFCSIDLYGIFMPVQCCFDIWPCSIVWYQVAWFLQLWSSFSRLLWLFQYLL